MSETASTTSGSEAEGPGVRLVTLHLPEDAGEGLGFRLTRTQWDPYPWVRGVAAGGRAGAAGLRAGDCLMQVGGVDLLGMPVSQVAGLIRGDGGGGGVSLLVWNCGVDPSDDPELLWSVGGGARGEHSRRALAGVVRALACCVCAATATRALSCARSHLYCEGCWSRLDRCALCRETLPAKDSPYARNLVAEQVFEAIAAEYDVKDAVEKQKITKSAFNSPNVSPSLSPATSRKRGQYQLSMMQKKKTVQFTEKLNQTQTYHSDPNIHRHFQSQENARPNDGNTVSHPNVGSTDSNTSNTGQKKCCCQCQNGGGKIPKITVESDSGKCCQNMFFQHKLITRLRPACSLVDLQSSVQACALSQSLSNINLGGQCTGNGHHSGSLDDLKTNNCDSPVILLSPPVFVLACDHDHKTIT